MADRWVAFIRNVMIGREGLHRRVLLDLFQEAGAAGSRSYISTGNVTFTAARSRVASITTAVEAGLEEVIGRREELFVRAIPYLAGLVAEEPFAHGPYPDPSERTVSFLPEPRPSPVLPIESKRGDVIVFAARPGELFAVNRLVDGRTSGAGGLIERALGLRVTTRSWNTVLRVVADPE